MSAVIAIELNNTNALLIRGEITPTGTVAFRYSRTIELDPDLSDNTPQEHSEVVDESDDPTENFNQIPIANNVFGDDPFPIEEADENDDITTLAVTDTSHVLYKRYTLPFGDNKTVTQIAPLQVQDIVPFDINDFLFDNIVLGNAEDGSYNILSSLIPGNDVGRTLRRLKKLGTEPQMLTTKASALLGLANLFPEQLNENYALIALSQSHCSIVLVASSELQYLADIDLTVHNHAADIETVAKQLLCAISRVESDCNYHFTSIYCCGSNEHLTKLFQILRREPIKLNLESVVENESLVSQPLDELSWALGLIASEGKQSPQAPAAFVDFRKGIYAYRPAFGNFIAAIRSEIAYIVIAIVTVLAYYGARLYNEVGELNNINAAIADQFQIALNEAPPASQNEVTYLQTKIADTTDQLREVGSLSTLSPLNLIKELSTRINTELQIEINRLDIGQEEVTFEGVVPNTPAVGKLDNILNGMDKIFCEVEVSPLGQNGGKGVRVRSKLKLCS